MLCNSIAQRPSLASGYAGGMAGNSAIREARLKALNSELQRGLSMVTLGRAEELREETRAMRAAIRQRRIADARVVRRFSRLARLAPAPH